MSCNNVTSKKHRCVIAVWKKPGNFCVTTLDINVSSLFRKNKKKKQEQRSFLINKTTSNVCKISRTAIFWPSLIKRFKGDTEVYICIYKCGGRVYLGIKCSMLW